MVFSLSPSAAVEGYRLESFESIGSTNQEALDRARAGDPGKLWLVTAHQVAGRGRRGRAWATPEGNLASTLLLSQGIEMRFAATLGFVAGLALAEALAELLPDGRVSVAADGAGAGRSRFELKWPNDVLADGAKLAGILLESTTLPDGGNAIAVGIGVNVVSHPLDTPYPAASLRDLGFSGDAADVFAALSAAWTRIMQIWDGGRGLSVIRERWLARAAGLGGEVAIRMESGVAQGVFETIDEDCRFVLRTHDGERVSIAAGDVHFGAVASVRPEERTS